MRRKRSDYHELCGEQRQKMSSLIKSQLNNCLISFLPYNTWVRYQEKMGCIATANDNVPQMDPEKRKEFSRIDIDPQCKALPYFSLEGKVLKYIGHFDEFTQKTQILWATPFPARSRFKVKILEADNNIG